MQLTEGIVLNSIKYQENSKVLYVLTSDGLKSMLVKNSLNYTSKNFSLAQELNKINFGATESLKKTFDIMTTGEILNTYKNIKCDYNKLYLVSNLIKLIYQYSEYITNFSNLYDLTKYFLDNIESYTNQTAIKYYKIIFLSKLLFLFGYGPNFKDCTICHASNPLYFSISNGGLVCDKCKTTKVISGDSIKVLKILYLSKLSNIDLNLILELPDYTNELLSLLTNYYSEHLSITI